MFVQWNSSKPKHQETVKSHRAEIAKASRKLCYFYEKDGGCRIAGCPFQHCPSLTAGPFHGEGTLTKWVRRKEKGKSFGFIELGDGNKLFCPERAFEGSNIPTRAPCQVRVLHLQVPASESERFVADRVECSVLEVN